MSFNRLLGKKRIIKKIVHMSVAVTAFHFTVGTIAYGESIDEQTLQKNREIETINQIDYEVPLRKKVTFIPDEVFLPEELDDQTILETIKNEIEIKVEAAGIQIGEAKPFFVENMEAAEQVIESLKFTFFSEEELKQMELLQEGKQLPLEENESRIVDVYLSEDITVKKASTSPTNILSVEQAVDYIVSGTLTEKAYEVKEGDVLSTIASAHEMTLDQLLSLNPDLEENSLLQIGQKINVTVAEPLVEVIALKEEKKSEKIAYTTETIEDDSLLKGKTKVSKKGKDGLKHVTYKVIESNGSVKNKKVIEEQVVKEPEKEVIVKGTKVIPSRGDGNFIWPAVGGYVSSKQGKRWGRYHKGIDIAGPSNRTIKASDNGIVVFAGSAGAYGNKIEINHQNGYKTVYAHLDSISVKVGQTVEKGTKIGMMGSTGRSTGVHLHFEIYKNGSLKNPLDYL